MDCEKFDKVVLDLLYQELDELGTAAAERHLDQCARCREIFARLRATRDIGTLPLVDPPAGFEHRVLAREALLLRHLPLRQRAGRAVSKLADYAMRPQLAMAALLMLMIGSSLIFLRAKPGEQSSVQVTERGMPETEADSIILPSPAAQGAAAPRQDDGRFATPPSATAPGALAAATANNAASAARGESKSADQPSDERSRKPEANQEEGALAKRSTGAELGPSREHDDLFGLESEAPDPASVALQQARDLQQSSGCAAAAPKFEEVNSRFPGSPVAAEATWRAAECRRLLGEVAAARQGYTVLLEVNAYRERARAALNALGVDPSSDTAVASKAASKPATSSPAGAAAEPAAPAKAKAKASAPAAASPPPRK